MCYINLRPVSSTLLAWICRHCSNKAQGWKCSDVGLDFNLRGILSDVSPFKPSLTNKLFPSLQELFTRENYCRMTISGVILCQKAVMGRRLPEVARCGSTHFPTAPCPTWPLAFLSPTWNQGFVTNVLLYAASICVGFYIFFCFNGSKNGNKDIYKTSQCIYPPLSLSSLSNHELGTKLASLELQMLRRKAKKEEEQKEGMSWMFIAYFLS